jgi:hypothetical protein
VAEIFDYDVYTDNPGEKVISYRLDHKNRRIILEVTNL